jgi:pSer/pThr/pTyr-binding forkhead associated (FHA) protein
MRVKLRVMKGAQAGREVAVASPEFLIGRGEECHLRPRSDAISRKHCAILVTDKQVIVHDLGSKNGSYLNGQRVDGKQAVQTGDQFQVGPLEFEIVIEHALGGAKRPAARDVKEVAARTAASSNEDLDIARWLEEEDDTDTSRAVATPETRQFLIDDTSNLAMETSVDGTKEGEQQDGEQAEAEAEEAEEEAEDKKSRWKKNEPGKLPPRPANASKDSREAAANMLKRFFNRG